MSRAVAWHVPYPRLRLCVQSLSLWKAAVQCANKAKALEGATVALDDICARFFRAQSAKAAGDAETASAVVAVSAWAVQRRTPHRVALVLAGPSNRGPFAFS